MLKRFQLIENVKKIGRAYGLWIAVGVLALAAGGIVHVASARRLAMHVVYENLIGASPHIVMIYEAKPQDYKKRLPIIKKFLKGQGCRVLPKDAFETLKSSRIKRTRAFVYIGQYCSAWSTPNGDDAMDLSGLPRLITQLKARELNLDIRFHDLPFADSKCYMCTDTMDWDDEPADEQPGLTMIDETGSDSEDAPMRQCFYEGERTCRMVLSAQGKPGRLRLRWAEAREQALTVKTTEDEEREKATKALPQGASLSELCDQFRWASLKGKSLDLFRPVLETFLPHYRGSDIDIMRESGCADDFLVSVRGSIVMDAVAAPVSERGWVRGAGACMKQTDEMRLPSWWGWVANADDTALETLPGAYDLDTATGRFVQYGSSRTCPDPMPENKIWGDLDQFQDQVLPALAYVVPKAPAAVAALFPGIGLKSWAIDLNGDGQRETLTRVGKHFAGSFTCISDAQGNPRNCTWPYSEPPGDYSGNSRWFLNLDQDSWLEMLEQQTYEEGAEYNLYKIDPKTWELRKLLEFEKIYMESKVEVSTEEAQSRKDRLPTPWRHQGLLGVVWSSYGYASARPGIMFQHEEAKMSLEQALKVWPEMELLSLAAMRLKSESIDRLLKKIGVDGQGRVSYGTLDGRLQSLPLPAGRTIRMRDKRLDARYDASLDLILLYLEGQEDEPNVWAVDANTGDAFMIHTLVVPGPGRMLFASYQGGGGSRGFSIFEKQKGRWQKRYGDKERMVFHMAWEGDQLRVDALKVDAQGESRDHETAKYCRFASAWQICGSQGAKAGVPQARP